MEIYNEEPVAVFKSRLSLIMVNVLSRTLPAAAAVMLAYFAASLVIKSLRGDPVTLFLRYWPYWLLLFVILSALWTLWFDIVKIYAYKTKILICKRGKRCIIDYDDIISFNFERSVMVFIPLPPQKTIVAKGSGRINKVKSCNCISKQDFFNLHHICNAGISTGYAIPMRRSTSLHA